MKGNLKFYLFKSNNNNQVLDFEIRKVDEDSPDIKYLSIINKISYLRANSSFKFNSIYIKKENDLTINHLKNFKEKSIKFTNSYKASYKELYNKKILGYTFKELISDLNNKQKYNIGVAFKNHNSATIKGMEANIDNEYNKDKFFYAIPKELIVLKGYNFYLNNDIKSINGSDITKKQLNKDIFNLYSKGYIVFDNKESMLEYIKAYIYLNHLKIHKSNNNFKRFSNTINAFISKKDREIDIIIG